MRNFPTIMPMFVKYIGTKVVDERPELKPQERALEWCFGYADRSSPEEGRGFQSTGKWPSVERRKQLKEHPRWLNRESRLSIEEKAWYLAYGEFPVSREAIQWPSAKPFEKQPASWWPTVARCAGCVAVLAVVIKLLKMY